MMQIAHEVKNFTCVRCPLGCQLEVTFDDEGSIADVTGFSCAKGKEYAHEEAVDPRRTLTSLVMVAGCAEPLSVKTDRPIPKASLSDALAQVRTLKLAPPIAQGDILIEDVSGTGANIIATKNAVCPRS